MDAQVKIKTLENGKMFLENTIKKLLFLIDRINQRESSASEDLEGNQFEIASSEITEATSNMEHSIAHMKELISNLDALIEQIREYNNCLFTE